MSRLNRRNFGARALQIAALAGLRTVNIGNILRLGLPLAGSTAGCLSDSAAGGADLYNGALTSSAPGVLLIGGGYGNAVTALRLTQRGIPVTMIEMGRLWKPDPSDGKTFCASFTPDSRAMWFKDQTSAVVKSLGPIPFAQDVPNQAGVLDVLGNEDMQAYVGRGVGGGSLVNMSIYVQPLRERLVRALPQVDVDELAQIYYPRGQAALRATQLPKDLYDSECYQYARTAAAAIEGAGIAVERCMSGYDYGYMRDELADKVPRSALGGEAGYGNNYGKLSLDKTYIAEAMATGLLTILPLHEVTRIEPTPDGNYVLTCKEIDISGNVLALKQLVGSHVFCGGGSMGTSDLLVRARHTGTLPKLSEEVGTGWGPNGDIFVMRSNPVWAPTGELLSTIPGAQFHTRDAAGGSVFSMVIPFPAGIETWLSFHIVMPDNPESGRFVYNSTSGKVQLQWHVSQNEPAVKSTRHVFDKINAAGSSEYNDGFFGGPEIGDRATYHPVGGCPLGRATDGYGRIPQYPGLYVTDGSLIPTGLGANPALTITALAERNIERVILEDF